MVKFTFLVENKTENSRCMAEHGLSVYIEADNKKLLFDTGASDLFYYNSKALDIELQQVDDVIISHGHFDHTGGIPKFCEINKTANIYIHKDSFGKSYGMRNGKIRKDESGIKWDESMFLHKFSLTEKPVFITDNIVVSGTIPIAEDDFTTESFYRINSKGDYIKDPMNHEQFLAIADDRGIFLFSGCSHKGVLPTIRYAKKIFPQKEIFALIAGMHLSSADKKSREMVIDQIINENIDVIMPVHCTGIEAICDLKNKVSQKCIIPTTGGYYEY